MKDLIVYAQREKTAASSDDVCLVNVVEIPTVRAAFFNVVLIEAMSAYDAHHAWKIFY